MVVVSKEDGLTFGLGGLVAFLISTGWYAAFGSGLLEKAFWFYAVNAFIVGGVVVFLFHVASRLRRLQRRNRVMAAAIFAAPGLIGAGIMLALFKDIFPGWDPASLGRYAAFILVGEALLASVALDRTKRAASRAR
ncbi:Uncharacterised protein family YnzE [Caulobacteraceae bacterium]